ncbi:MAG: GNAT family protein [Solibacillus sp.]|uniref:GNAT family N-acetyltransferase n=1 Tax=unclassified Solibacillus TaxID=2637870 RepID=UPI0030FBCE50
MTLPIKLVRFNGEKRELINLLCTNAWNFHSSPKVDASSIEKKVDIGFYENEREAYWIIHNSEKIGFLIIEDIEDSIPLFDLRLTTAIRGKGIGLHVLLWLQDYLFGEKAKIRIEAYTRADNLAMRKCLMKAGFVKEGYLRNAWENDDGTIHDSVLYAVIFEDWKNKTISDIKLFDLPF